jgi:hypothetical protein
MRNSKEARKYLHIHAFSYHFSWLLFWGIFVLLLNLNGTALAAWIYYFGSLVFVCSRKISLLPAAILYTIIFPILHLHWFRYCLIDLSNRKREIID